MKDRDRDFMDMYKSVRKKMPPPEKTIKPKGEEVEKFDWRKELEEEGKDDYKSIGEQKEDK